VSEVVLHELPASDAVFTKLAGASDLFELTSSKAILSSQPSRSVAAFARQMIRDHTMMSQKQLLTMLKFGIVTASGQPPLPKLTQKHRLQVEQLLAAAASQPQPALECLYLQQQVLAHQEGLQLHSSYAENGPNPVLRQLATAAAPIVQQHLLEAQQLLEQNCQ
jgi:putative membrane protein